MKTSRTCAHGALIWSAGFRRPGRRRLAPSVFASHQISAILSANGVRAVRLKEPVAALSGLLQTDGCILPSLVLGGEGRNEGDGSVSRFKLTRAGSALIRQSFAPSNQRSFLDVLGGARPFSPSSRLPSVGLRGRRIGGVNPAFPASSQMDSRIWPALFPRESDHQDSTLSRDDAAASRCDRSQTARHFRHWSLRQKDECPSVCLCQRAWCDSHTSVRANRSGLPTIRTDRTRGKDCGRIQFLSAASNSAPSITETCVRAVAFNLVNAPFHPVSHPCNRSIPFPHAMPDSDSPWESRSRLFAGRKSSALRASGALRDEFLFLSPSATHPV